MELELFRDATNNGCTLGSLSVNGVFQCYTLEPPISGVPTVAIPAGTYPVSMGWSAHFQRVVPHINLVPERTEIEIHPGNFVTNTQGCVLVGEQKDKSYIMNSDAAFEALFAILRPALLREAVSITVHNP